MYVLLLDLVTYEMGPRTREVDDGNPEFRHVVSYCKPRWLNDNWVLVKQASSVPPVLES